MKITPKKIVLDLLMAGHGAPLSSKEAVSACVLFGLAEVSTRVAITRLQADGLIQSIRRGVYVLGPQAQKIAEDVALWRHRDDLIRSWQNDYVMVYTQHLGRTDRTALIRRERALNLWGFRALEKGLYIRPNNLTLNLDDLRSRLCHLGLESTAILCLSARFDPFAQPRIEQLWQQDTLNQRYLAMSQQLQAWVMQVEHLALDVAAQQSLLLGRQAIHDVVFDPLLPDSMIDTPARTQFFCAVRQFDDVGQLIWGLLRKHSFDTQAASIQQITILEQLYLT
jgi:phenylacetic acid degradation operon negative regulatory protein